MLPRERGVIPKLLRQHILLTLVLRVSDPRAPSSSWRKLLQWQEYEQPFVTQKPSCGWKHIQSHGYGFREQAEKRDSQQS